MGCKLLRDKLKDNFAGVKKMDKLTIVLYWKSLEVSEAKNTIHSLIISKETNRSKGL